MENWVVSRGGRRVNLATEIFHCLVHLTGRPRRASLENHMLDKMGHAVCRGTLAPTAHSHPDFDADNRGFGPLLHQKMQTTGQNLAGRGRRGRVGSSAAADHCWVYNGQGKKSEKSNSAVHTVSFRAFAGKYLPHCRNIYHKANIMTFPLIEPRLRRNLDRPLLLAMFLLMGLSIATVYFAKGFPAPAVRQGVYFIVGLVLMVYVAAQDYNKIARFANFLYWGNILVLIGVLFIPAVKGSSRWIPVPIPGMDLKLQPSEFVKVVIILTLSAYVVQMGGRIREFPYLLRSLAHIALPVGLIMKQPDLGTGLVVIAIWAGIVFLAGANWKHMVGPCACRFRCFLGHFG